MKRYLIIFLASLVSMLSLAQPGGNRFDPERFQADLESFITKEAALSPRDASCFFPVYREYMKKNRSLLWKLHSLRKSRPCNNQECANVIKECDEIEIELKELQQEYHKKFLKKLTAKKAYAVIKAEDKFFRESMSKSRPKHGRDMR